MKGRGGKEKGGAPALRWLGPRMVNVALIVNDTKTNSVVCALAESVQTRLVWTLQVVRLSAQRLLSFVVCVHRATLRQVYA